MKCNLIFYTMSQLLLSNIFYPRTQYINTFLFFLLHIAQTQKAEQIWANWPFEPAPSFSKTMRNPTLASAPFSLPLPISLNFCVIQIYVNLTFNIQ